MWVTVGMTVGMTLAGVALGVIIGRYSVMGDQVRALQRIRNVIKELEERYE